MLICAKAYFFSQYYDDCLETLSRIRLDHSTKVLYERQALYIKAAYLKEVRNMKRCIEKAVEDFHRYKGKCPGRKILTHHEEEIKQLK